jgi:hypothetical protein
MSINTLVETHTLVYIKRVEERELPRRLTHSLLNHSLVNRQAELNEKPAKEVAHHHLQSTIHSCILREWREHQLSPFIRFFL